MFEACPENVFESVSMNGRFVIAKDAFFACMACVLKCPERAITVIGCQIGKVEPPDYPPEEGRYIRGNDYSPVAVVAILDTYDFKISRELIRLLDVTIEAGAALAGVLQTGNIGIEKIIANVVANPNIRYIVCVSEEVLRTPASRRINRRIQGVA